MTVTPATARIYSPTKTAMQSGKSKTGYWVLEYLPETPRRIEPLMGYTSSSDMRAQVKMKFDSKQAAIAFAEREGIAYSIAEPKSASRRRLAYADNFSFKRSQPWTH